MDFLGMPEDADERPTKAEVEPWRKIVPAEWNLFALARLPARFDLSNGSEHERLDLLTCDKGCDKILLDLARSVEMRLKYAVKSR